MDENLSHYFRNKFVNILIFFIFSFLFEFLFLWFSFNAIFPNLFFLDAFIFIILGLLCFLFHSNLFDKIYLTIIQFFIAACFCLNSIFYKVTGDIFVIENLFHLDSILMRTADHKGDFSFSILFSFIGLYLLFIIIFYIFNFFFNRKKSKPLNKKILCFNRKIGLLGLVSSLTFYAGSLSISSVVLNSNGHQTINNVTFAPSYNAKYLGLLTYYVKNLGQLLFPHTYNIDDLKEYFTDCSYVNDEFTGLLEGYNVVSITIETGGKYALNKYTMPNLYSLLCESADNEMAGINCSHNYSKNSTVKSELISSVGNLTSFDLDEDFDYVLPFSLPNELNEIGYDTYYFADLGKNGNDIFKQRKLFKKIGYKNFFFHEDLLPNKEEFNYQDSNFPRDSVVMESIINKISAIKKPFYINYCSLCMHHDYDDNAKRNESLMNSVRKEFDNKLSEYEKKGLWINPINGNDSAHYRNYSLCSMDTDKAIGELINYLKERNLFDKTLFVFYGDHDLSRGQSKGNNPMSWQISGKNNFEEISNYSTILGFYNKKLNQFYYKSYGKNEFLKFTSPAVIVPTVLDLLGVKYNPKFYQGKSIFDPNFDREIFYSSLLHEFMNENYLSRSGDKIDKVFNDNDTSQDFINKCKFYFTQLKHLNYIYSANIFRQYDISEFMPKE